MSRHDPLYDWTNEVATQFPHLSKPQATVLALWSFGIVLAHCCTLSAVANMLSPRIGRCYNTVRQRLREWYKPASDKAGEHRRELDVTTCFVPLLAWILKNWPSPRVALALDATTLADRLTVLSLSLVYRGTAIPVAWKVLRGNQPHAWKPEWLKLLCWFDGQVDPTWTVTVMTDRGLYARWLFQAIVTLGWHPMMRVTRVGKFQPEGWSRSPLVLAVRAAGGLYLAGPRRGLSRHAGASLGVHAVGLLDRGTQRWLVCLDRPASPGRRRGLVRPADVDRARLRAVQIGGLAVAEDANQRTRSRRTDVVGHGLGDLLGGRRRRPTRARRVAPGDRARTAGHRHSQARPGQLGRETTGQRVPPRSRRHPGPAEQRPACQAREVVSRAVAWS